MCLASPRSSVSRIRVLHNAARRALLALSLLVWAATGCGSPSESTGQDAAAAGTDAAGTDAAGTDAAVATATDAVTFDFASQDDALQCPGGAGCACSSNVDCSNGLCVETAAGGRCAVLCTDACPAGFACRSTASTGDPISYCAPVGVRQCASCHTNADCNAPLSVPAECVEAGATGSFCASVCKTSADCREGSTCQPNPSGGNPVCLPSGGAAACTCSAWAVAKAASTACSVLDGSKQCPGVRSCGPAGLTACEVTSGAQCVDAGCADASDGSPCDDGDPCTQSACQAGLCVATKNSCACQKHADCEAQEDGNPCNGTLICDTSALPYSCQVDPATLVVCAAPDNPCQTSTCSPLTGTCQLANAIDGVPCEDGDACTADTVCGGGVCSGGKGVCECKTSADCVTKEDGNPCNGTLYCDSASHACKVDPTSVVVCASSGDPCQLNACVPATGSCAVQNLPDTTPCDDGAACTIGDVCMGGSCKAGTVTCACAADADCATYEDGNFCNGTLFCNKATGQCQINPKTVVYCPTGLNTTCQQNVCEPSTGVCGLAMAPSTTLCDDGNPCSGGDHCADGSCTSTTELCPCDETADCAASEDGNLCNGTLYCELTSHTCQVNPASVVVCPFAGDNPCAPIQCQPTTGECAPSPVVAGSCDDGDPCTAPGGCLSGQCVQGPNICQCKTSADCLPFDDNNPCNGTLYCDTASGQCKPNLASVPVCLPAADACSSNACDPTSGTCKLTAAKNGAQCSDGEPCTKGDACESGSCKAGPSVCACITHADCASKDDGDLCNGTWLCNKEGSAPACVFNPASVVSCNTAADGPCLQTTCNPTTGQCSSAAQSGGCDDGDACTTSDACSGGACLAGSAVACDDNNPCTTDSCEPATGCVFTPNGELCDDGNLCTQADVCSAGACVGSNPVVCAALDQCHEPGVCEPASGECSQPTKNNDAPCSDGDACTSDDACAAGACVAGSGVVCDDGNPCTADSCDPSSGCVFAPNGELCNDGNLCTQADVCSEGACVGSNPVACTALDECHDVGVCDPASGGCSQPAKSDGSECTDGDACTQTDSCSGGLCIGANPVVCLPLDQCHAPGACKSETGLCSTPTRPDGFACTDGDGCTVGDVCSSGACQPGASTVCDDDNACTSDSCDNESGACVYSPVANETPCDDGSLCTELDVCWSGSCEGLPCGQVDDYTSPTCDPAVGCVGIEICNGMDDDGDGSTDNVVCGADACTCDADGIATCPADCTQCPNYDDAAISVTDASGTHVRCVPDWHAWGLVADMPDTLNALDADTVEDTLTGRMWQRQTQGSVPWSLASSYCDTLVLAGFDDWRLPTLAELESIVDFRTVATAIDTTVFVGTKDTLYWTSIAGATGTVAWVVSFDGGSSSGASATGQYGYVRCVR